jgi:hypothetical protein
MRLWSGKQLVDGQRLLEGFSAHPSEPFHTLVPDHLYLRSRSTPRKRTELEEAEEYRGG